VTHRIALLGWGSLLWEGGAEFDAWHEPWHHDGPSLPIEFSRISRTRGGALTGVIDPEHGVPVRVAWCLSRRAAIAQAVEDLRTRERTAARRIGWVAPTGAGSGRDAASRDAVRAWAAERGFDAAVWTDLPSNFAEAAGAPFSVPAAIAYLRKLDAPARAGALDYIRRAPAFLATPLRVAIGREFALEPAPPARNA